MPDILIRQANIAANDTVHPFEDNKWSFRFCPFPRGLYTILVVSDGGAGGLRHQVLIGTTQVVAPSDTSVGGTDGIMPTPAGQTATPAHQFYADQGDEIDLIITELAGVATTDAMIWANVEPA